MGNLGRFLLKTFFTFLRQSDQGQLWSFGSLALNKKTAPACEVNAGAKAQGVYRSAQIVSQLAAAAWMAQFAQRLSFDLADALARETKLLAHFFEGVAATIL